MLVATDFPARARIDELPKTAHGMRHYHLAGGEGIGILGAGVTADDIEEAVDLTLGVMEATGAGPTVGAGVDCLIAKAVSHTVEFPGRQPFDCFPGDFHERLAPATLAGTGAVLEPSLAHHWRVNARRPRKDIQHALTDG